MSAVLQPSWVVPVLAVVGALIGVFLDGVVHGVPQGSGIPRRSGASAFRRGWLVTVGTAVAYALIGWGVCAGWYPAALMPALLYWAAIGIVLGSIDIQHHRLPNAIVLPSYVVTATLLVLASILTSEHARLVGAVAGAAVLFVFYWILAHLSPGGMGFGDVKLAGALGMLLGWCGWGALVVGGVSAFVLGGAVGALIMIGGRASRATRIPFGPFMLIGAGVGVLAGADIVDLILGADAT